MDHDSLIGDPLEPVETPRLVLRAPRPADAAALAALANDRSLAEMMARLPHPYTIEHANAFLARADRECVFAVTARATGLFMGLCGLRAAARPRTVDLGYWLGRLHWGRGYATEAVQAVVDLAFGTLPADCVSANCRAINGASRRVLEKCGFQHRGMGTFVSVAAGRVASEDFHLDRRAWVSIKAWGAR